MDEAADAHWDLVLAMLRERMDLPPGHSRRLRLGKSPVFEVGADAIIKLIPPYWSEDAAREIAALQAMSTGGPVATPGILALDTVDGWIVLLMSRLRGTLLRELASSLGEEERVNLAFQVGELAAWLHRQHIPEDSPMAYDWAAQLARDREWLMSETGFVADGTPAALLGTWPDFLAAVGPLPSPDDPPVLLHGDLSAVNLLVEQDGGRWRIKGLLDFGDASLGQAIHDWLSPGVHDFLGNPARLAAFADGYGLPASERSPAFRAQLLARTVLYYGWRFLERTFPIQQATTWEEIAGIVWPLY
jgi:hygromycin-B 7''-O-kinase